METLAEEREPPKELLLMSQSSSNDLGNTVHKQEFTPSGAFQVGKLLSNSMPLYGLAMLCTPQLKKYMLLRAILLPIPKQTPFQEHGRDCCQPVVQHSSFPASNDTDTPEDKGKSVCTWVVVWLTIAFPGEEGADCCTVRICCPNATFSGTPTVFWGEVGGWEATDTTVSCLAKQKAV